MQQIPGSNSFNFENNFVNNVGNSNLTGQDANLRRYS